VLEFHNAKRGEMRERTKSAKEAVGPPPQPSTEP
jgi:hypothetical protein